MHFRKVVTDYCIQEGFETFAIKSTRTRVTMKCKVLDCPWRIHASCRGSYFVVKTYNNVHTCQGIKNNEKASSKWMTEKLRADFAQQPNMTMDGMKKILQDRYNLSGLPKMKLYRDMVMAKCSTLHSHDAEVRML